MEFAARRRLAATRSALAGVYAGQPGRTTTRPTAERLLASFREVTLTIIEVPGQVLRHLTPLTALQHRILDLLDCAPTIYHRLASNSLEPP